MPQLVSANWPKPRIIHPRALCGCLVLTETLTLVIYLKLLPIYNNRRGSVSNCVHSVGGNQQPKLLAALKFRFRLGSQLSYKTASGAHFAEGLVAAGVVAFVVIAVFAGTRPLQPHLVVQIPIHCLANPFVEADLWLPAQFAAQLRTIERIAAVVTRAVSHKLDERLRLAQDFQNGFNHGQVSGRRPGRNVVDFARLAALERTSDRPAVIFHI